MVGEFVVDEYLVIGERNGRWLREHRLLASPEEARTTVADMRFGSPDVTWHVVRRTTTVTDDLADDVLDDAGHQPGPVGT